MDTALSEQPQLLGASRPQGRAGGSAVAIGLGQVREQRPSGQALFAQN